MGTEVVQGVDAAEDLELVAMVDAGDWLFDVANAGAQVVVDFTRPDVVMDNIRFCIDHDIHCVVGTTGLDRKSTRLNSSHANISYAVFCLKKKKNDCNFAS